jgi:hypothetical protein
MYADKSASVLTLKCAKEFGEENLFSTPLVSSLCSLNTSLFFYATVFSKPNVSTIHSQTISAQSVENLCRWILYCMQGVWESKNAKKAAEKGYKAGICQTFGLEIEFFIIKFVYFLLLIILWRRPCGRTPEFNWATWMKETPIHPLNKQAWVLTVTQQYAAFLRLHFVKKMPDPSCTVASSILLSTCSSVTSINCGEAEHDYFSVDINYFNQITQISSGKRKSANFWTYIFLLDLQAFRKCVYNTLYVGKK